MSALLIPLAKGFLGLMGVSSFMFLSIKQDVEIQMQEIELEAAELELEQKKLEQQLQIVPEKK